MTLTKILAILLKAGCKIEINPRSTAWGANADLFITPSTVNEDPKKEIEHISAGAAPTIPIHAAIQFPIDEQQLVTDLTEIAYFIQALPRPKETREEL